VVREDGKPARTRFTVVGRAGGAAVIAARPETGRTHQIRVHLAWLGHPIAGDTLYARDADRRLWGALGIRRPCLHAEAIDLLGLEVIAPLPLDMVEAIERARRKGAG
jgi:23S rRNA pseudouridine955/2504/2580 synthase